MKKNLIFFLGTKAQFIKTIPIINAASDNKYNVYLYDTCQHRSITEKEINKTSAKITHIFTSNNYLSASSIFQLIVWFLKSLLSILKKRFKFKEKGNSICIIHGNTLSTILGLVWAKKNKIEILHIEGGYRSFNWFKPFPEEIIRYITSKFSDYVVCFDSDSFLNLSNMNIKGNIIQVSRNTIYDQKYLTEPLSKKESKLTISIHRNENIFNRKRLANTVDFLIEIKKNYFESANWFMHSQTKKNLERYNHIKTLNDAGIFTSELIDHETFIKEIKTSKCVVTDGESILEECKIIGTPTYALLNKLENKKSEGQNILVSEYKHQENKLFFDNLEKYALNIDDEDKVSPSNEIIKHIDKIFKDN